MSVLWYLAGTMVINGYYGPTEVALENQFSADTRTQCLSLIDRIRDGEIIGLKVRTDNGYVAVFDKGHWVLSEDVKCVRREE